MCGCEWWLKIWIIHWNSRQLIQAAIKQPYYSFYSLTDADRESGAVVMSSLLLQNRTQQKDGFWQKRKMIWLCSLPSRQILFLHDLCKTPLEAQPHLTPIKPAEEASLQLWSGDVTTFWSQHLNGEKHLLQQLLWLHFLLSLVGICTTGKNVNHNLVFFFYLELRSQFSDTILFTKYGHSSRVSGRNFAYCC